LAPARRANKNHPAVVSSRIPVPRFRETFGPAKYRPRDPRFEEPSGQLDDAAFRASYSFLEERQREEEESLRRTLKRAKSEATRRRLQAELSRIVQQAKQRERHDKLQQALREHRNEQRERVEKGAKPFYLKRSAVKKLALENRFEELRKSGKLTRHLERKRKRNAAKERRWLPSRREAPQEG